MGAVYRWRLNDTSSSLSSSISLFITLSHSQSHTHYNQNSSYIVSGGQTGRRLSTYFYAYTSSYNHLALLCAYVPIFSYYCMMACATAHAHTQLCFTRGAERVSSLHSRRLKKSSSSSATVLGAFLGGANHTLGVSVTHSVPGT